MRLRHASYRCHFEDGGYVPVIYNWDVGTFSSAWIDDKWHDLIDHDMKHFGLTTEHMAEMVGELTGRKVKRVSVW